MRFLFIPVIVAVVVSLGVVVAAALLSPEGRGLRGFFQDLRAGLSDRVGANRGRSRLDVEPVDTTLDDFFAATATQDDAYVAADGLANRIEHVVDGVASRTRR
ncbi:MAG: hypothetical protein GX593_11280 [Actinomycetales bacterium]|nr:hypothetical protein [Actinomycetales bacterium]